MKHFIVIVHYVAPLEKIDEKLAAHRAFLQDGYERGLLLMSGPREPRTEGILVARATSLQELQSFLAGDPYQLNALAEYDYIEFRPVKYQPFIKQWVNPVEPNLL